MPDQTPPPFGETDSGMRPAASLTAIPVRRRSKSGMLEISAPKAPRTQAEAPVQAPAKPRKEPFGKLRQTEPAPELRAARESPEPPATPAAASPAGASDSSQRPSVAPQRPIARPAPPPMPAAFDEPQKVADTPAAAALHQSVGEPAPAVAPVHSVRQSTTLPPEGIIALWERLAGEESMPRLTGLDMAKVAAHWPNSLLLRAAGSPRRPRVEVARIFSAGPGHDGAPVPVDTMAIDWMMGLAREVAHDGVPVHELGELSADDPAAEYGVIALPFGASPAAVDHVLCHLYRYQRPPDDAAVRPVAERPVAPKSARRMVAAIFGRRPQAAG
jgi:hypothetical protein